MIPLHKRIRCYGSLTIPSICKDSFISIDQLMYNTISINPFYISTIDCLCNRIKNSIHPCHRLFLELILQLLIPNIHFDAIHHESRHKDVDIVSNNMPQVLSVISFLLYCNDIWPELPSDRRQYLYDKLISMEPVLSSLLFKSSINYQSPLYQCISDLCIFQESTDLHTTKSHSANPIPPCHAPRSGIHAPCQGMHPQMESSGGSNLNSTTIDKLDNSLETTFRSFSISSEEWLFGLIDLPTFYSNLIMTSNSYHQIHSSTFLNRHSFNTYFAGILLSLWINNHNPTSLYNQNHSSDLMSMPSVQSQLTSLIHRFIFRETASCFIPWFVRCLSSMQTSVTGFNPSDCPCLKQSPNLSSTFVLSRLLPSQFAHTILSLLYEIPSSSIHKHILKSLWISISSLIKLNHFLPSSLNPLLPLSSYFQITCPPECKQFLTCFIFTDIIDDSEVREIPQSHILWDTLIEHIFQIVLDHESSNEDYITLSIAIANCLFSPVYDFIDLLNSTISTQSSIHEHRLVPLSAFPPLLHRLASTWNLLQRLWADGSCVSVHSHLLISTMIISFQRNAKELWKSTNDFLMKNETSENEASLIEREIIESISVLMKDEIRSGVSQCA